MSAIVIVGAGECGVRAAFGLRENGFDGSVTLIGEEDLLPYERPPLSKNHELDPKFIYSADAYDTAKIDLLLGKKVASIDCTNRQIELSDGLVIRYDKLLLATGARARLFPSLIGCLTLRTQADAEAIMTRFTPGAHVGIIGGGFIGLELASSARSLGADVTVIEAGRRILGRAVPEAIASAVHTRHVQAGVRILTGTAIARTTATQVYFEDGSHMAFDVIIAGIGAVPNTELATNGGLNVENGIVVDRSFKTSDAAIFAAGDCCNFIWRDQRTRLESWKAAQDQGTHVAGAMLGDDAAYAKAPWFWSDQYDLTLCATGIFDLSAETQTRSTSNDTSIVFQLDPDGVLTAAAGIGIGNSAVKELRIFEKLIERAKVFDGSVLCDPATNLKRLLRD